MRFLARALCAGLLASNGPPSTLATASRLPAGSWRQNPRSHPGPSPGASLHRPRQAAAPTCAQRPPDGFQAPKANIWHGLTDDEAVAVTLWLFEQQELNLTAAANATAWDNTVDFMQLLMPNKTDALAYVDGDGPEPPRYAQVSLNLRATEKATFTEITVGPLPVGQGTTWEYLTYPYSKERRGRIRNINADDTTLYLEWLAVIGANMSDITLALWNKTATGAANDTLLIYGTDPTWQDDGRLIRWDTFWAIPTSPFDSISLLPQGLFVKSDVTGRDPSKWKLEGFVYNDIFYATENDFREAFYSDGFKRLPANVDGAWTGTDQQGPRPPLDQLQPPVQVVPPTGARYSIDHEARYIRWLDWTFFVRIDHSTGVGLHDVRHKDERILYELAMQEALAHYTGNDPVASGLAFLDTYDGFAANSRPLIPGYDCPLQATYMNISFFASDRVLTNVNAICLFESDTDHPIARHKAAAYVTATKNIKFVLRWVATIRNYDYLFSYEFYLDGSMQIKLQASGYISAAYAGNDDGYGYRVHDQISASPHEHVVNFKADFDVLGKENSLQLAEFVPVTKDYVWSDGPRNTFQIERSFVESENQGRMTWSARGATQYNVVNTDRRNRFGEYRGYRIAASGPTAHLTAPASSNLREAVHPFTFDLAVTRRKDTEPKSAHHYNGMDVLAPMVNFDDFFDGESLRQEDIVLWFNLGMHHLPSSGDIPNTLFNIAHTSVQIVPVNFHETDPSRETGHRVRIDLNATTGMADNVELFGQEDGTCAVTLGGGQREALYEYGQGQRG